MTQDRPSYLASGEPARLIPTYTDSNKELRSTSVFLASIMAVPPFGKKMLGSIDVKCLQNTRLETYTEVTFNKQSGKAFRPDGLIIVKSGKKEWRALVEAKVGNATLEPKQLQSYLDIAKDLGFDALITISNQLSILPGRHPNTADIKLPKNVSLFHWSWTHILTETTLLVSEDNFDDPEQRYILSEVARYLKSPISGVSRFDRMNAEWKELVSAIQNGVPLNEHSKIVQSSVSSIHQEQRDICLLMSRRLSVPVELKLPRNHTADPQTHFLDDCKKMARTHAIDFTVAIPNAASPVAITADIARRNITCSMSLDAPEDKKSTKARVNWILRQLKEVTETKIFVRAHWPGRTPSAQVTLAELRENPDAFSVENKKPVRKFDVLMVDDLMADFGRTTKFIVRLETFIPHFYHAIGQTLRAWKPLPPTIKSSRDDEENSRGRPEKSDEKHAPISMEGRQVAPELSTIAAMADHNESVNLPWTWGALPAEITTSIKPEED